jgi:hypothetical protein
MLLLSKHIKQILFSDIAIKQFKELRTIRLQMELDAKQKKCSKCGGVSNDTKKMIHELMVSDSKFVTFLKYKYGQTVFEICYNLADKKKCFKVKYND